MALIAEQPAVGTGFTYSRQPIVYRVTASGTYPVGALFYGIFARVSFSLGGSASFSVLSETVDFNTNAVFDIHEIVCDGFERPSPIQTIGDNPLPPLNLPYTTINRHWYSWGEIEVEFYEKYSLNGIVQMVEVGNILSNTLAVVNGGVNHRMVQPYGGLRFLTVKPFYSEMPIKPSSENLYFWSHDSSNKTLIIRTRDETGSFSTIQTANFTGLSRGVYSLNVGTANNIAIPSGTISYEVLLSYTGGAAIGATNYNLTCVDGVRLHWLNQFGGFDSWTFPVSAASQKSQAANFTRYQTIPNPNTPPNFIYSGGGTATLNVTSVYRQELNNGETNDTNNQWLRGVASIDIYEEVLVSGSPQYIKVFFEEADIAVSLFPLESVKAPEFKFIISDANIINNQRW